MATDDLKALSEKYSVPGVDLRQVVIPTENLSVVPEDVAKRHLLLPILVKDDQIVLAMEDPRDSRTLEELEFVTGKTIVPYVATKAMLTQVIGEVYALRKRGEPRYIGPNVPADYLASIGLGDAPARASAEPPSRPIAMPARAAAEPSSRAIPLPPVPARPRDDAGRQSFDELGLQELEARARGAAVKSRTTPARILVVDDEDDIRQLLSRVLKQKGYEVIEASKGMEALQRVRDDSPDLLLLDAMLPEVNGFEICRRIKGSKRYGQIPIIMLSAIYRGWRMAEDLRNSYGVDAFLEKPFKLADVLQAVERALAGAGAGEQALELSAEAQQAIDSSMESYRNGDIDGAIVCLREGLTVDPTAFELHYHLGLLLGRKEEVFEAIHELEKAIDLLPRHFGSLKNLAVLYQRVGFRHKAMEMWERALSAAPDAETRQGIKEHLVTLL